MVDVLSSPPRSVTLQFPVLIVGPGEYEGLADEKEGYFYPGCCIDRFLHIQHTQLHTCGSIRRYLLQYIQEAIQSTSASMLLAQFILIFGWKKLVEVVHK